MYWSFTHKEIIPFSSQIIVSLRQPVLNVYTTLTVDSNSVIDVMQLSALGPFDHKCDGICISIPIYSKFKIVCNLAVPK